MIQFTVDVIRSLVRNLLLPLKAYWNLIVHVAHCEQYVSALSIATSSIDTVITVWPKRFIDNNINIRVDIVNTSIRIATDHNTELWLECRKLQSCNWLGHNFCKHVSSWTTLARDFTGFHVFANKVVSYVDILARLWNIGIWIKVIDLWVSSSSKIATVVVKFTYKRLESNHFFSRSIQRHILLIGWQSATDRCSISSSQICR